MAQTEYDRVEYPDIPFVQSHPDRLAALALLHGLRTPPVETARVLDLGCGAGANALAIAAAWPDGEVVGVDLASTVIERARATAAAAGVPNVRFEVADIRDLTAGELGTFDYVVAHGFYTWVPLPVREALVAACASHLAPDGVALVSYNVYPGAHFARAFREAALWHARASADPIERAQHARDLFTLLGEGRDIGGPTYSGTAGSALADLVTSSPEATHHDILNDAWDAVWFSDFVSHVREHGLDYLCEGWVRRERPASVQAMLERLGAADRIEVEQYADIVLGRRFRVSLLCRHGGPVQAAVDRDALRRVVFTAADEPGDQADPAWLAISWALADALPAALSFDELQAASGLEPDALAEHLVAAMGEGLAIPRGERPRVAITPGERPVAYPLARWQAATGQPVTTVNGVFVSVSGEHSRLLLRLLDGTRDSDRIRADFQDATGLALPAERLAENLRRLAGLGLLTG